MGAFVTRYQITGHITAQQYVESWWLKVRQVIKYFAVIKEIISAIEYIKGFISNLKLLGYGLLVYGLVVNKYIYIYLKDFAKRVLLTLVEYRLEQLSAQYTESEENFNCSIR